MTEQLVTSQNTDRKLATVENVLSIAPIKDADRIEIARIRGWDVVVKKDEFTPGDEVIYFEVDSFLPLVDPRFEFLAPRGVRTMDGVEGHVLKTARLRGQYSQGLVLPKALFPELADHQPGDDVTALIPGLRKWEPPIPAGLEAEIEGAFPSDTFRKTYEERIQNTRLPDHNSGSWVATEKIDGSSTSVIVLDGVRHVASRNYLRKDTPGNRAWDIARELRLHDLIEQDWPGKNVAVQGELFGPGIQGNPLKVSDVRFLVFSLQVGEPGLPAEPVARNEWPEWLRKLSVPVHELDFPASVEEALTQVEKRRSLVPGANGVIEGVVWRRADTESAPERTDVSFKVIANSYILKHDQ